MMVRMQTRSRAASVGRGLCSRACLLLLFAMLAPPAGAATRHVPEQHATIQEALNAAASGDSILVAPGVYQGPLNRNLDFGGKDLVLTSLAGAEQTILDCADIGRGFRFANGETRNAIVDGFTILRGRGLPVPGIADAAGGGVLVLDSSPTIKRCVLQECGFDLDGFGVGPAVFVHQGSPRMVECEVRFSQPGFEGNGAGAVYGDSVVLEDCVFLGNVTAVYLGGASVVSGCRFEANSSARLNLGGATFYGQTVVTDCLFRNNRAYSWLGSEPAQGGGASAGGSNVRIERCVFDQNFCEGLGGGLAIRGGVSVIDCVFTRNHAGPDFFGVATYGGGGLYVEGENVVRGCLFAHNRADGPGGALRCESPQLDLTACTFAGNYSADGSGGALACFFGGQIDASRILVWDNCASQGYDAAWIESGATLSLACSDVRQSDIGGGGTVIADPFTFESDPQFCEPGPCASSPEAEGDYSINYDSPCTAGLSPCGERVGALDPACWVTDVPVGESIDAPQVRLLRNPAPGQVTFQLWLPGPREVALTIHDPTGRRLHHPPLGKSRTPHSFVESAGVGPLPLSLLDRRPRLHRKDHPPLTDRPVRKPFMRPARKGR